MFIFHKTRREASIWTSNSSKKSLIKFGSEFNIYRHEGYKNKRISAWTQAAALLCCCDVDRSKRCWAQRQAIQIAIFLPPLRANLHFILDASVLNASWYFAKAVPNAEVCILSQWHWREYRVWEKMPWPVFNVISDIWRKTLTKNTNTSAVRIAGPLTLRVRKVRQLTATVPAHLTPDALPNCPVSVVLKQLELYINIHSVPRSKHTSSLL
jgi:hypothetical protein